MNRGQSGCLYAALLGIIATGFFIAWTVYSMPSRTVPAAGNVPSMVHPADDPAVTALAPLLETMIAQNYSPTPTPTVTPTPVEPTPTPRNLILECSLAAKPGTPCALYPLQPTSVPTPTWGPCPSPESITKKVICYP